MDETNKCDECKVRETLEKATEDARKAQARYLEQVRKVNETLAKYNRKIEELDSKS